MPIPLQRASLLGLLGLTLLCAGFPGATADSLDPASYLHTQGKDFRDRSGKVVMLRGVDIGGWLVTEGWMCGQKDRLWRWALEQLEARFGPEKAARLMAAWYDNWFTTRDLDRIQGYGFNLIRVPFGYRNLQDAKGEWKRDAAGEIDFSRLDWVVREAGQRGIYVILDLHIWQGQKEKYARISRNEPGSEEDRAHAVALWTEIAKHFKGNGAIAAFDLINEPEGCPGDAMQRAMYEAIRRQDPERVIIGESMWYTNFSDKYWTNAVWSAHYPVDRKPGTVEEKVARWEQAQGITDHPEVPAPIFIGEMKAPEDTAASAFALAQAMNRRGWSWAVWTYKGVNVGGWASFNYDASVKYDLAKDSYESLLAKWTTDLTRWQDPAQAATAQAANYYLVPWWTEGYGKGATAR